jgi:hypothetical protein
LHFLSGLEAEQEPSEGRRGEEEVHDVPDLRIAAASRCRTFFCSRRMIAVMVEDDIEQASSEGNL